MTRKVAREEKPPTHKIAREEKALTRKINGDERIPTREIDRDEKFKTREIHMHLEMSPIHGEDQRLPKVLESSSKENHFNLYNIRPRGKRLPLLVKVRTVVTELLGGDKIMTERKRMMVVKVPQGDEEEGDQVRLQNETEIGEETGL